MKSLRLPIALFCLLMAAAAPAQDAPPAPPPPASAPPPPGPPPRLVIMLAIDQLSADGFAQWRQHYTGGLRRLAEGVVFPSGYQQHAATETCPGHATLLTGSNPARTGIIANNWFDLGVAREDKLIYCAEDPRVPGSTSRAYTPSPVHLKVPVLGDWMKRADPGSRNVAVAGKDRAALMMSGQRPDAVWWWGVDRFVSHPGATSAAADAVNAQVAKMIAAGQSSMPLSERCAAQSRAITVGDGVVGIGRFERKPGEEPGRFRYSPAFDGATLALAAGLIAEMNLGRGRSPDILSIGLSATDYIGHGYGTEGSEMCIGMEELDRSLGDFFARLDASGIDYVVAMSADHGGMDLPERATQQGIADAQRVDPALAPRAVSERLAAQLGLPAAGLVNGDASFGDMWVSRALTPAQRARTVAAAKAMLTRHPQVEAVFTREEIMAIPVATSPPDSWTLLQIVRAAYDPARAGDYVVLLRPRITPIAAPRAGQYVATHGSPWIYDRRVPIVFWRRGMARFEQPLSIATVDIMPTLAGLLRVPIPADAIDGRCRDLDAGYRTTCP